MAGAAPTEYLQHTEVHDKKLPKEVATNLTQAGYPATPQTVNPNDESPLESIKRDVEHWAGSTLKGTMGGASNSVNDRGTKGRIATLIGKLRGMKKVA